LLQLPQRAARRLTPGTSAAAGDRCRGHEARVNSCASLHSARGSVDNAQMRHAVHYDALFLRFAK
jgi:hypothetical protein